MSKSFIYSLAVSTLFVSISTNALSDDHVEYDYDKQTDTSKATIDVASMDFSTEEGLEGAMMTIEDAALHICTETKPNSAYERDVVSKCYRDTVKDVVGQIDNEELTAYYEDRKTPEIVDKAVGFFDRFRGDE